MFYMSFKHFMFGGGEEIPKKEFVEGEEGVDSDIDLMFGDPGVEDSKEKEERKSKLKEEFEEAAKELKEVNSDLAGVLEGFRLSGKSISPDDATVAGRFLEVLAGLRELEK